MTGRLKKKIVNICFLFHLENEKFVKVQLNTAA